MGAARVSALVLALILVHGPFGASGTASAQDEAQDQAVTLDYVPPREGLVKVARASTRPPPGITNVSVMGRTVESITEFYVYQFIDGRLSSSQRQTACDFEAVYAALDGRVRIDRRGVSGEKLCDEHWPIEPGASRKTEEGRLVSVTDVRPLRLTLDGVEIEAPGYVAQWHNPSNGREPHMNLSAQGYGSVERQVPSVPVTFTNTMHTFEHTGFSHIFARCQFAGRPDACGCVIEKAREHLSGAALDRIASNMEIATVEPSPVTLDDDGGLVQAFVEASRSECLLDAQPMLN